MVMMIVLAYIGHPAYKKMGARQAYSIINCLIYLPLCIFGIIALFLNIIAVVAVNPVIVSKKSLNNFYCTKRLQERSSVIFYSIYP